MIIQFNSLQFAVYVQSPYLDDLLDNGKFISLKIEQAVWNNITQGNIKFYATDLI